MTEVGEQHLRSDALLRVEGLRTEFAGRSGSVQAVSGVSFDVLPGETLGLVGESGCGKSTTALSVMRLQRSSGRVTFDGTRLDDLRGADLRHARDGMKMIFQDPRSSLNPRRRIADIVGEPFEIWGRPDLPDDRVRDALAAVGMDVDEIGERRPHEFSGGQCQRISIARAIVRPPKLLWCDEAVSALDVSVQAQILNLLEELRERFGLAMVFISHDLPVVREISDRIAVMYLGRLCEVGEAERVFTQPAHPYTRALLEAAPDLDQIMAEGARTDSAVRWSVSDDVPSPADPPSGCRYRTRCPLAQDICATAQPEMRRVAGGQQVACHFPVVCDDDAAAVSDHPI